MSNYALVEDGKIVTVVNTLPSSWKNISGLHHSKDNEKLLNSVGWYTIQKDKQSADIIGYDVKLVEGKPVGIPVYQQPVIITANDVMDTLRFRRDAYLAKSDWTQLQDVQTTKSQSWKDAWASYRQQLRDLPGIYSGASTIEEVNFPQPPQE